MLNIKLHYECISKIETAQWEHFNCTFFFDLLNFVLNINNSLPIKKCNNSQFYSCIFLLYILPKTTKKKQDNTMYQIIINLYT